MVDSLKYYVKQTKNWNMPHSVELYCKKRHKKGLMHVRFINNLFMSMKRMCQRKICYRLYYAKVKKKMFSAYRISINPNFKAYYKKYCRILSSVISTAKKIK